MADYTLAVGTQDPVRLSAGTDADAVRLAVDWVRRHCAALLAESPHEVVTLLGSEGLLTRPSERLDAFVERVPGPSAAGDPDRVQPGDSNTPDCNGG